LWQKAPSNQYKLLTEGSPISKDYRVNNKIRVPEVRVVGPDGQQIGVLPIAEALRQAEDKGLDLVEIVPEAKPPVCKIIDSGSSFTTRRRTRRRPGRSSTRSRSRRSVWGPRSANTITW
jgi:translation initiation factor IF-3